MSHLNALLSDLRNRKVWPIAAALLAALIAIPVLLHRSPAPAPVAAPTAALPIATATGVPTVTTASSTAAPAEPGGARDPFTQQSAPAAAKPADATPLARAASAAAAAVSSATSAVAASATGSTSSGAAASSSVSGATSSGASPAYTGTGIVTPPAAPRGRTTPSTPVAPLVPTRPRPAPSGLGAREHYDVTLAITDPTGGFTTIDPFERLRAIPSQSDPQLVELGVLAGGRRVLFAVAPNATVSGPATCVPGPLDCEVLSVTPGADETVASGAGTPVTFQVTGVAALTDGSAALAAKARATADPAGAAALSSWQRSAFALFPYDTRRGVIVDERNLIVGGN